MALLDRRLKQRIVGAAVLLALVVVFLPMLFNREDEQRRVRVEAPPMPPMPPAATVVPETVAVPEPQEVEVPGESFGVSPTASAESAPSSQSVVSSVAIPSPAPRASMPVTDPAQPARHLDADGVPVTWSVQLASLSSRTRAEELQQKLRSQGFDAYIRTVEGMHRVFVGPLIEREEAERVSERIARQHRLSPIVVRFQPERR